MMLALLAAPMQASAFCGFYVAKADTELFNKASKVVLVRDEDRTVITMVNDYEGDAKEFAMVVPVPTLLKREQIHVTENAIVDHLDAYTAPRLVEYFDGDPCNQYRMMESMADMSSAPMAAMKSNSARAKSLGVKIEAEYTVGEYDILILSAKESNGLQIWLDESGYKTPKGAKEVLASYIKQGTKFFVAKVNLKEKEKLGNTYLRPLQIAFESPKFMLPIRLGTVNAKDTQELFVFTLTKKGRVETTNYRNVKIPTGNNIPIYVKEKFGDFYKAMFDTVVKKENMKAVFEEYAWDMNWCDPCAADPLSNEELQELGVFWLDTPADDGATLKPAPMARRIAPMPQAKNVFVTRLHLRYDGETFPDDLKFQHTADRTNFQGRYVMQHPFKGEASCDATEEYRKGLAKRYETEAKTLANLTGWDINEIRTEMTMSGQTPEATAPKKDHQWWKKLWKD